MEPERERQQNQQAGPKSLQSQQQGQVRQPRQERATERQRPGSSSSSRAGGGTRPRQPTRSPCPRPPPRRGTLSAPGAATVEHSRRPLAPCVGAAPAGLGRPPGVRRRRRQLHGLVLERARARCGTREYKPNNLPMSRPKIRRYLSRREAPCGWQYVWISCRCTKNASGPGWQLANRDSLRHSAGLDCDWRFAIDRGFRSTTRAASTTSAAARWLSRVIERSTGPGAWRWCIMAEAIAVALRSAVPLRNIDTAPGHACRTVRRS